MAELKITKENFDAEVMRSDKPVLIDFWAAWCGPCGMLAPVIAEIAEEYEGRIKVGKINVDEEPELTGAFQISAVPTVTLVKNGVITKEAIGFRSKEQIEAMLQSSVQKSQNNENE